MSEVTVLHCEVSSSVPQPRSSETMVTSSAANTGVRLRNKLNSVNDHIFKIRQKVNSS